VGGVVAVAMLAVAISSAQEPPWSHMDSQGPRTPLPSSSVQRIQQDSLGYIWLGFFSAGLARYDGTALESYGLEDGLVDLTVRDIVEDSAGRLWVGCETGLVVSDRPLAGYAVGERVRFREEVDGEPLVRSRVRRHWLAATPDGGVLQGTSNGDLILYHLDSSGLDTSVIESPSTELGRGRSPVSALVVLDDGTVWLALEDGVIAHRPPEGGAWSTVASGDGPTVGITTLGAGRNGGLWAGGRDGSLWRWSSATGSFERTEDGASEQASSILEVPGGGVWLATLGAGVVLVDPTGQRPPRHFTRTNHLPSETVWDVTLDREGTLWFGHNGGLSRLAANWRAFEAFTGHRHGSDPPLLPDPTTFAVLPPVATDPLRALWIGTGGGLVALRDGRQIALLDTRSGLPSASVYALAREGSRRLWIGTLDGLECLTFSGPVPPGDRVEPDRRIKVGGRVATLSSLGLRTVYEIRELDVPSLGPSVWVASTSGLQVLVRGRWHRFGPSSGLPSSGTACLAVGPEGDIWVGTRDQGLLRSRQPIPSVDEGGLTSWVADTPTTTGIFERVWHRDVGAPSNAVNALRFVSGRLWAATGTGLYGLDTGLPSADLQSVVTARIGIHQVSALAWDPVHDLLWAARSGGLVAIDPRTGDPRRAVSRRDGLIDDEVWAGAALAAEADGSLVVGTPKGVSLYHPDLDLLPNVAPIVRIRSATYHEDTLGHNVLDVRYSALSYVDEDRVQYRTRLVGLDPEWSTPTPDTVYRFTNLAALLRRHRYRFEVIAQGPSGSWSPVPAAFDFIVSPAWYLRWWSVLTILAAAILAVAIIDSARTRRLVRRTRSLEQLVEDRTSQVLRHVRVMETLDRIVETVNREVELTRVMEALLNQGLVLLPRATRGAFLVRDPDSQRFEVAVATGWEDELAPGGTVSADEARRRFTAGARSLGEGVYGVQRLKDKSGLTILDHLGTSETLLTIDLPVAGELEGFLVFELDPEASEIDAADRVLVQRYRQHAISALEKASVVQRLEEASRAAAQASKAKSDFLATMSHELRTPLNSIIGFSEILLDRSDGSNPRHEKFLRNILTSGRHLLSLINDILDLSKIEAGRMSLEPEEVDLRHLLDGVFKIVSGIAAKRHVELVVDIADSLPPLHLDAPKLKHILYNLVSNAIKFSHDRSTVTVRAAAVDGADSPVGCPSVAISVSDTGIGIAPGDIERIFDEFYQVDSGPGRRFVGTGLGLALVRRYVELHGGAISVDSQPGLGATFSVHLPTDARPFAVSPGSSG
jgi:signal transduction histidine kinase/ligand-binding sensor domain-containing protein